MRSVSVRQDPRGAEVRKERKLPTATATVRARTATGRPVRLASRSSFGRFRVGRSRIPKQGVERTMPDVLSARSRVSPEVARRSSSAASPCPFPIQALVLPDALAGLDVLAKSPTGLGQDPRLRPADRRAHRRRRRRAVRARARADARARLAGRAGARRRSGARRTSASPPSTAARRSRSQSKRARGAHILVATPGRLQDLVERRLVSLDRRRASSSSTRPTGCSTWASSRRSTGSSAGCRASARRCSSRRRSTARSASSPARTRATRRASRPTPPREAEHGEVEHTLRLGHARRASSTG